jgi:thiosulfate/3-mercaptopyruvate sulfurtransferase
VLVREIVTAEEKMNAPRTEGPLIYPDALAELLASPATAPTLLDVRWQLATGADHAAYVQGHIPGAAFVDLDTQLADPPSKRGRHPLPGAEWFTDAMQLAGVSGSRLVVVYDADTSMAAARAWWLLRYFGHPAVAVLDGGLAAWVATGHPLKAGIEMARPGDFVASPGGMPVVAADQAAEIATAGVLLDARARERYLGVAEPVDPVAGHIPGARNRPTSDNVDPHGRFLDPTRLRTAFEQLGVRDDVEVAAYCGSGISATHEVLALERAGFRGALYPGSWSEWITDPQRPIASETQPSRPNV